ncbi:MAG: ABC transporter permease [Alphaproteobacteria bacterium]|nr:ABC transporter permease [Alphaproteobacteria bacterium]
MIGYVIRRLLMVVPVMAIVTIVVFVLSRVGPGDPAAILVGDFASSAEIARTRAAMGLDRPLVVQYFSWLSQLLHGDLGISIFSRTPVLELIVQSAEPTLLLTATAMIYSIALAVPVGVLAAARAGSSIDRALMGAAVLGFSTPVFVLGYMLAYVFGYRLGILPVQGYPGLESGFGPVLRSLTLPAIAIGATFVALIARVTRASMLEVLSEDYIRTARAKGLPGSTILLVHALKNAAIPVITMVGIGFGVLLSGVVVTESVFAIPGIGRLTVNAIFRRDFPVIQGVVLVISLAYVLLNLAVDLTYTLFDPRIRY